MSLWAASPGYTQLVLALAGVAGAVLWGRRGRRWGWAAGCGIIVLGILAGFLAHRQQNDLTRNWDSYWVEREAEVGARLDAALQARLISGETAADTLAAAADPERFDDTPAIRRLRLRNGVSALALYDPNGNLVIWDGVHRGKVPEEVQSGQDRFLYFDLPLFGYLYVTSVAPDGSVAVAAHLLRTDLPRTLGAQLGDFGTEFFEDTGESIRISGESPSSSEGVWDLALPDGERLLSVVVARPEVADRVRSVMARWQGAVSIGLVLAWLLLVSGGPPRLATGIIPAGGLLFLAAFLPFQLIERFAPLFDPSLFALPGPIPMSLGRMELLAVAGFTAIAVLPRPRFNLPIWAAAASIGITFPLIASWARGGLQPLALASGRLEWLAYETALAALLALVVGSALIFTGPREGASKGWSLLAVVSAIALAAAGGALVALSTAPLPMGWFLLWAAPAAAAAAGMGAWSGWQRTMIGWLMAVIVATAAAAPTAWRERVSARIDAGSAGLEALSASEDPELERGLFRLAAVADSLAAVGKGDLDVLYGAWRASGLSEQPYSLTLTMWDPGGTQVEELVIGIDSDRSEFLDDVLHEARDAGAFRFVRLNRDDARYAMGAPLSDGRVLTVFAPPIPSDAARSPLGSLMRGGAPSQSDALTMFELLPDDPQRGASLIWEATATGWQGDVTLEFANRTYHAHHAVDLPGALLATARGSLLLVVNMIVFLAFWLGGRALLRDVVPSEARMTGFVISFRARVTMALFGFFALANALFGTVAYRTLEQTSTRSARVIAERVVEDAAGWFLALEDGPGSRMERLATQVGAELLEYRDGELRGGGGVAELVELGLYEGWMPLRQHRLLDGREGIREFMETSLGRWEYVTAYRRLPDGDILGAQVPLRAGATAIETTDLIELLGFAMLVGGVLSLVLAWMAGRALTSPIRALQVASESVGAGNLGLRLPSTRADEFGAVFRAFNRMVGRVRRARRQLVRTSRRTQAIMDEAAVGMVALDSGGRVTLVNPRAEKLLGAEVFVGRPVPGEGPLGEALSEWLARFLDGTEGEDSTEFHAEDRRVRLRARRLGSTGAGRGVVVALDDVTDELRTERVLAWGEMARQVAHEVKNPLTPIKLSIQHIRRAWEDEREDFGEILVKNADAMLTEIDRLADIAQSFSRFGAPGEAGANPLAPVSVQDVVDDLMALYAGASSAAGSAVFEQDVASDLPPVRARLLELKEVLVNLLENSRAAVGEGGVVRIRAHESNGRVVVQVVDDGDGIPEELLPRIFEPQFSTRSTGAGLGLPIVQRLAESWGGAVEVDSAPGRGTTVSVLLSPWNDSKEP